MAVIGYARVSTDEQSTATQVADLRAAGCDMVHEEHASGANRSRPVLARSLERIRSGDTLVVVRIDRLARSLSHLLHVIETLEARGAYFRSLRDHIDTGSPQGKFTLQILGAVAEFERALIRERTKAGLKAARARGNIGGNPGVKSGDREAIRKIGRARDESFFSKLDETSTQWVPEVRRLRPALPWEDVVRAVNARLPAAAPAWTRERLIRAVKRYVQDGLLPSAVLERAPRKQASDRQMALVAGIAGGREDITLEEIAARLEQMRERTPRGRDKWQVSSVKMLLDRAKRHGLLDQEKGHLE